MLRALGAFLGVFSLLSLIVNLSEVGSAFAIGALCLFAIDFTLTHSDNNRGPSRAPWESLR